MGPSAQNQAQDAPSALGLTHRILSGGDPRVPATSRASDMPMATAEGLGPCQIVPGRHPLQPADAEELFDLRGILEGGAIRQAVARATQQQLAALDAFRSETATDFPDFLRDDAHFHLMIAELSGNRRLAVEAARLIDLSDRISVARHGGAVNAACAHRLLTDHGAIIDALQARDAARAVRLAAQHLARTRSAIFGGSDTPENDPHQVEG